MKKRILVILVVWSSLGIYLNATTKQAEDVFKKWDEWQHIHPKLDISNLGKNISEPFIKRFKKNYENTLTEANHYRSFLSKVTNNQINEYGYRFNTAIDDTFKANLQFLYTALENDVPALIDFLQKNNFLSSKSKTTTDNILEKNLALTSLIFSHSDEKQQETLLFSVANRFFNFCFGEKTFPMFQKMILNPESFELSKFFYSNVWYHLAGSGWKNWSQETLTRLTGEAKAGKTIVYIAGGSDLYQLLKQGIYNVRVIDPQLPSQIKYYTNDWAWFTLGDQDSKSIGDEIIYNNGTKTVTLKRALYQETGEMFQARLANNQIVSLPKSFTVWNIFNENKELLGSYIFERRFVNQKDFEIQPNETLLMSFNELFFISVPEYLNGWGIEPSKFPQDTIFHIKQLHEPVTKQVVCNMHIASILNSTDLQYISLGTCIN